MNIPKLDNVDESKEEKEAKIGSGSGNPSVQQPGPPEQQSTGHVLHTYMYIFIYIYIFQIIY